MYSKVKKLGQGGYGSVYLLKHKVNGDLTAAKFVDVTSFLNKADNIQKALKEAQYLLTIDHENIINLETVFLLKKEIIIFTEYVAGGELKDYILNRQIPCTESEVKKIAKSLIAAIGYIHQNNIVHRDLKLENILLNERGNPYSVKIIDFGISGLLSKVGGGEIIQAGTLIYSPPEIVAKKRLESNPKIDVWSLGVILYILLTKEYPF